MKITKLYPPKNNSFVSDLPIRTQTLFGALANSYVELFGEDSFPNFLKLFEEGSISSGFPAISINGKEIFFLPKPYLSKKKKGKSDDEEQISKKKTKKIKWLSFSAMQYLINSIEKISDDYFHSVNFLDDFAVIGEEFIIMKDELEIDIIEKLSNFDFYKHSETVRVNVARFGGDSVPFDQSHLTFCDVRTDDLNIKTFLYFIEEIESNDKWKAAKQLMIENGIGGKRSLGKGYFEKIETKEIEFVSNSKLFLLLSNAIPEKRELNSILYYDILIDDGFITRGFATTLKKDGIFCLKEGSVVNANIKGKIIPESFEDKTIYRYGKAFLFPFGGTNE